MSFSKTGRCDAAKARTGACHSLPYLWRREFLEGREEGSKDRPCAIVLAISEPGDEHPQVLVVPVTHAPPANPSEAIELPPVLKQHLGLDDARSWVVVSESNLFRWPGSDLRRVPGRDDASVAYGFLPPRFFEAIRHRFLGVERRTRATWTERTE